MIGLLIALIFWCVVLGVVWFILQQIPLLKQPPLNWVVPVLFGLVVLMILLNYLPGVGLPHGRYL